MENYIIISIGSQHFVSVFHQSSLLKDMHLFRDCKWLSFFESTFHDIDGAHG